MAAANPSKSQKQNSNTIKNNKQIKLANFLRSFSNKVQSILNESQKGLKLLMLDLDQVIVSQSQIKSNRPVKRQDNHEAQKMIQEQEKLKKQQLERTAKMEENIKKLKIGQLNKKKQQLMQQLRFVDKTLIQSKLSDPKDIKNQNGQFFNQQKSKIQLKSAKKPLKRQQKVLDENKTLQIMENFNKQKIRRHEQIIDRMKKRQQEQIRKIQDLQERRIKIQLKRSRINNNASQGKQNSPLSKSMFPAIKNTNTPINSNASHLKSINRAQKYQKILQKKQRNPKAQTKILKQSPNQALKQIKNIRSTVK